MIHFAIGTKAQFIKMAPIMHLLQGDGEPYHLLDLSQHGSLTGKILADFGLAPIVTRIGREGRSVTTYSQAVRWLASGFIHVRFKRRAVQDRLFIKQDGVALIHGDTLSTLLGLYLAKAAGLKTALVEAGLSSGNLFDPFPEEWIRRHVGKRVDYLFPPDVVSEAWLRKRRLKGRIVNTGYNTGKDSLDLMRNRVRAHAARTHNDYGIVTLHRLETLSSRRRLKRVINHILDLAQVLGKLHFYMHPPTENALRKTGLIQALKESANIHIFELAPYPEFINALSRARFVLTDGGSIQEESFYLRKPCLILRNRTERNEGIGKNAILSTWNPSQDASHLHSAEQEQPHETNSPDLSASRTILNALQEFRIGCGAS